MKHLLTFLFNNIFCLRMVFFDLPCTFNSKYIVCEKWHTHYTTNPLLVGNWLNWAIMPYYILRHHLSSIFSLSRWLLIFVGHLLFIHLCIYFCFSKLSYYQSMMPHTKAIRAIHMSLGYSIHKIVLTKNFHVEAWTSTKFQILVVVMINISISLKINHLFIKFYLTMHW